MVLVIGEILIDRFPDYERIGGAPFNFAYHLKNFGIPVRFISCVGNDSDGKKIRTLMKQSGFDTKDLQIDPVHPTGNVEVTLDKNGVPDFNITKQVAYDNINLSDLKINTGNAPEMIYFGTLAQRTDKGFKQIQALLQQKTADSTTFCDINLRAPHYDAGRIDACLRHSDILKLSDDELIQISVLNKGPSSEKEIIDWLMTEYGVSEIILTRGANGSCVISHDQIITSPPLPKIDIVDTVGAGDAYAAVTAAGILNNLPREQAITLATDFAAQICTLPGAVPNDKQVYTNLQDEIERISNDR